MSVRRLPSDDSGRPLVLDRAAWGAMWRAAWHGFSDDDGEFDPPEAKLRQPTRAWCQALYSAHRQVFLDQFEERPAFLAAWPVATFDPDKRLRARAEKVLAARRRVPAVDPRRKMT